MMKGTTLIFDFSGMYEEEGFLSALASEGASFLRVDGRHLQGTQCYCDTDAARQLAALLPRELPLLRWLDTGDYHYLTHLLALRETAPFHLVLLDHHRDDQAPAWEGVLSCGSWVQDMRRQNPWLRDVLTIGPEGCPSTLPETWLEAHRGERVYLSIDKDILDRREARTDWDQGVHTLAEVQLMLASVWEAGCRIVAVDVCGGCTFSKGATAEDRRLNLTSDLALYRFLSAQWEKDLITCNIKH